MMISGINFNSPLSNKFKKTITGIDIPDKECNKVGIIFPS